MDFILTTYVGQIEHVRNIKNKCKMIKIYLDDIIFTGSLIENKILKEKEFTLDLHKFLNVNKDIEIYVDCKSKEKVLSKKGYKDVLVTGKGNYFYTKKEYELFKSKILCSGFYEYETKKLFINGKEVLEVKEFEEKKENSEFIFGTEFLNNIIEDKLLTKKENIFILTDVTDEYTQYLLKIKETNGKIYVFEHNYNVLLNSNQ